MAHKAERREFLIAGQRDKYTACIHKYQNKYKELQQQVIAVVCQNFNVPKDLWNKSTNFYNSNSVFAPQIYEFMVNFTNMQDQVKEDWFCELKKTELLGHY